ncbi:YebC/PmpR family DNA-binding transcriptional regulator [Haliangium sp.]|uniref:YebC/PmpR family DNA-binding transcriptional regulator n=1 Tax=Haliangium sp. TaxID=2663208 RepID=UPI003D0FB2B7
MSGHSKWSTIKRKKAAVDAKRSKVWTKVLKEVQVAARMGGGDPEGNARLRMAMDKARGANVPKDTLQRAIDKGTGAGNTDAFEEVVYEGYGPGGVAVVLECMTDNRNRTVSEIRHSLEKYGGNMGTSGSVAWLFKKRGIINVLKDAASEEDLMMTALEAGADDVRDDDEVWTVETDPSAFIAVQDAIRAAGIEIENAEIDNIPDNRVDVPDDKAESLLKMLNTLEDLDDVQNVYANHEMSDELLDRYGG